LKRNRVSRWLPNGEKTGSTVAPPRPAPTSHGAG